MFKRLALHVADVLKLKMDLSPAAKPAEAADHSAWNPMNLFKKGPAKPKAPEKDEDDKEQQAMIAELRQLAKKLKGLKDQNAKLNFQVNMGMALRPGSFQPQFEGVCDQLGVDATIRADKGMVSTTFYIMLKGDAPKVGLIMDAMADYFE